MQDPPDIGPSHISVIAVVASVNSGLNNAFQNLHDSTGRDSLPALACLTPKLLTSTAALSISLLLPPGSTVLRLHDLVYAKTRERQFALVPLTGLSRRRR